MYALRTTRSYRKALKKMVHRQGFKLSILEAVIEVLVRGEKLAPTHRDHQLSGNLARFRECHVQSDVLLVYEQREDVLVLVLVDLGSHSDLFGK